MAVDQEILDAIDDAVTAERERIALELLAFANTFNVNDVQTENTAKVLAFRTQLLDV